MLNAAKQLRNALAQEPDGEDGPGGQAGHECDDNPSLSTCPAPPPTRLSLSIRSTGGGDDFQISYSRSSWSGSSSHFYRFELHRASTGSSSYTYYRATWDGVSPAYFYNNPGGYTYKVRAKRCRSYSTSNCGNYSTWSNTRTLSGGSTASSPAPTNLRLSLSSDDFTLTWSRSSGSSGQYYAFELHRATSRLGSYTRNKTANDTYSSTAFSNVTRDRYYKARGKRCTTSSRTTCGSWSSWSSTVYVGLPPPTRLRMTLSTDDFTLTWSSSFLSGYSSRNYQFELHRATSRSGSFTRDDTENDTYSSTRFTNVDRDRYYKARGRRCTTSSRSTCGEWSSWSPTVYVGLPPPTNLRMTLSTDDFTLTWSRSSLSGYSTRYYQFELHRATSRSGSFIRDDTENDSSSSTSFTNVDRDRYYKARGRRCTTSSRSACGEWSSWSSTVYVGLPPPTNLRMALSTDDFTLTWSRSSLSGYSSRYYQFELHRATSRSGSFIRDDTENDSSSSTSFTNVDRDRYYKARGRRCTTSSRSACGEWSSWSSTVYVGLPPPASLRMTLSDDDFTLAWSRSYLRNYSTNYYVFELHRSTSRSGTFTRDDTVNDSSSSTPFTNVDRDRYYKARGKRCTTSSRSTCGEWSSWSSTHYVGPAPPTSMSWSRSDNDLTLTWSRGSGNGGHYYVFELHRATTSSGSYTRNTSVNDTTSTTSFNNVSHDYHYKARAKRCTTSSRSTCGPWAWSPITYLGPAPPTSLSLSLDADDFTLSWSRSSGNSSQYYVFELHRASSSGGSYTRHATVNDTTSSTPFANVTRDRYYKARGKRCTASGGPTCGDWSSWSSTKYVGPAPPTSLSMSLDDDDFTVTWSRSSGSSQQHYVFELHWSATSGGSYTRHATANDNTSSTPFDNVTRDRHYKARGKRCTASNRSTCGEWSAWSSVLYVGQPPPTGLSLSLSTDDFTLTWSRSSGSSSHYYTFELHYAASSGGTFNRDDTANDTASSTSFSDVTRDRYYKARGKRCTSSGGSKCGEWSSWSNTVRVLSLPPVPSSLTLSRSTDDLTLTYSPSSWTGGSGNYYKFELRRSTTSGGTYSSHRSANDEASPLAFNDVDRGYWYKARGTRCTDAARTDCAAWPGLSSALQVPTLPDPPTLGTITVSDDDLSVAYTRSTWADGTNHYYEIEAHKSTTESGSYTRQSAVNSQTSPAAFSDLSTGWYKSRGRRCVDAARMECGAWSSFSDAVEVAQNAPPPTALALTLRGDNTVRLAYTPSIWTGHTTHDYKFELLRSPTSSGTYTAYDDDDDKVSPLDFDDVHTGYYYKARGKRCASAGTNCGSWSTLSGQLNVPLKSYASPTPSTLKVSGDEDDMTVAFTQSTVTELNSHNYVFQLHRADSASGTFLPDKTVSATTSPAKFEDIDRSKVYKARGKRCKTVKRKVCGPWSSLGSTWDAPSPPSAVTLLLTNKNMLSASYTRSTTPTATTHYYQLKLVRSETASGTYADYGDTVNSTLTGSSATASKSLGAVHTGYHYKAIGRRCSTASAADCGEWSSMSNVTAVNVPATDESAPSMSASKSTEGDDIEVTFTTASGNGPSGQTADPDPTPDVEYYVVELRRSESSGGTLADYKSSNTDSDGVTFTDVDIGWFYKARSKACAATDRKLCGPWTPDSPEFGVAAGNYLPALDPPTLKPNGNGVIRSEVTTLPSSLFVYVLTLESSETGERYTRVSSKTVKSTARYAEFTGLDPTAELYYVGTLRACHRGTPATCGTVLRSTPIRIPVITWKGTNPSSVDLGTTTSFAVSAKYLPTDRDFKFVVATTSTGDNAKVFKFNACTGATAVDSHEKSIAGRKSSPDDFEFSLLSCSPGNNPLRVSLMSGTTQFHTINRSTKVNQLRKPENVIANGHTAATLTAGSAAFRFDPIAAATHYNIKYVNVMNLQGRVRDLDDIVDTEYMYAVETAPAAGVDLKITDALLFRKLYAVRIQTVWHTETSDWSDVVYVYPTTSRPATFIRIGDLRIDSYLPSSRYEYTLCGETFPSQKRAAWLADIRRAIPKWDANVVWLNSSDENVIRTSADSTPTTCRTSSETVPQPWKGTSEIRHLTKMADLRSACGSSDVDGCVASLGLEDDDDATPGELVARTGDRTPYIIFSSVGDWDPGHVPNDKSCSDVESQMVHEIGHAFGIEHAIPSLRVIDSIMYSIDDRRTACVPSEYDIAALMGIYQSTHSQ